jgi:hypothetical protein
VNILLMIMVLIVKLHIKFNIIYKNFVFNYEYIGYEDYKGKADQI